MKTATYHTLLRRRMRAQKPTLADAWRKVKVENIYISFRKRQILFLPVINSCFCGRGRRGINLGLATPDHHYPTHPPCFDPHPSIAFPCTARSFYFVFASTRGNRLRRYPPTPRWRRRVDSITAREMPFPPLNNLLVHFVTVSKCHLGAFARKSQKQQWYSLKRGLSGPAPAASARMSRTMRHVAPSSSSCRC